MPKTLTIQEFIEEVSDKKIFFVSFIKKTNGEYREMNAIRGVGKGVKNDAGTNGSWNRVNQDKVHNVLTCYDSLKLQDNEDLDNKTNRGAFRRINLDDLVEVKAHGVRYKFDKEKNLLIELNHE